MLPRNIVRIRINQDCRLSIPKRLRQAFDISPGDIVEIEAVCDETGDYELVVKKIPDTCLICRRHEQLVYVKGRPFCMDCLNAVAVEHKIFLSRSKIAQV